MNIEQLLKDKLSLSINHVHNNKQVFWSVAKCEWICLRKVGEGRSKRMYQGPSFEDALKELLK